MMSTLQHPLVLDYLTRLEAAAASLAPDARAELLTDLGAHIEEAASHTDGSDDAIRAVLDRLGPPEEAAREAGAAPVAPPPPVASVTDSVALEMWALALLVGSVVMCVSIVLIPLAPLALITGLVLLFLSRRWSLRDKLLGLAAYGIGGPLTLVALVSAPFAVSTESCSGGTRPDGTTWEQCSGGAPGWLPWAAVALGIGLVVLWVGTLVRLYRRATASAVSPAGRRPGWLVAVVAVALLLLVAVAVAAVGAARFTPTGDIGSVIDSVEIDR